MKKYFLLLCLVISLLHVSCTSLNDIHNDKIQFVKSILNDPDRCEEIIINSEFYVEGVSDLSGICKKIKQDCYVYGKDNLSIEIFRSDDKEMLYIHLISPDKRAEISFAFFNEGNYKDRLKSLGVVIISSYHNNE